MQTFGTFMAGVVTGWALRASFDSMRGLAVSAIAAGYELSARARRLVAEEREFFEDMVAEARTRFEARREVHAAEERAATVHH